MSDADLFDRFRPMAEAALEGAIADDADCPARLTEAMRYALLGGGKRLRPVLTLAACELVGGDPRSAVPAAVAVEMVHAYSLVHDDLPAMDDDDLRRGRPTCHRRFDEATAILAGDGLLTEAFAQLAALPQPAAAECVRILARASGRSGMVGGQMADLRAEVEPVTDADGLRAIHRRKTGALITAALAMGGRCGKADAKAIAALARYGGAVGLLFQITDDLLDATGDAAAMGKAARKDSDRGKATYPSLLGIDRSRELAHELAAAARSSLDSFGAAAAGLIRLADLLVDRDR